MNVDVGLTGIAAAPQLSAKVLATEGRGLNPHELGHMLLDKVFYVSADAPPSVREQAAAYRNKLYALFVHYLAQAQTSQNTTVYNILKDAGQHEAAELVRKL
jgi:hypothetical protein